MSEDRVIHTWNDYDPERRASSAVWAALKAAGYGSAGDRGNKLIVERGWPGTSYGPAPVVDKAKEAERKAKEAERWERERVARDLQERERQQREWEAEEERKKQWERDNPAREQRERERLGRKRLERERQAQEHQCERRERIRKTRPKRAQDMREWPEGAAAANPDPAQLRDALVRAGVHPRDNAA
jgi:hypothetical protein